MKFYLGLSFFIQFTFCSGVYYGIDGPDVLPRKTAVSKINDAYLVKFASCGFDSTNVLLLVKRFSVSDRKNLDGAFYATKDIDACVQNILFLSCTDVVLFTCNVSPKDFFGGGGLFQGGI